MLYKRTAAMAQPAKAALKPCCGLCHCFGSLVQLEELADVKCMSS